MTDRRREIFESGICPECPQYRAGTPVALDFDDDGATCPNCGRWWASEGYLARFEQQRQRERLAEARIATPDDAADFLQACADVLGDAFDPARSALEYRDAEGRPLFSVLYAPDFDAALDAAYALLPDAPERFTR